MESNLQTLKIPNVKPQTFASEEVQYLSDTLWHEAEKRRRKAKAETEAAERLEAVAATLPEAHDNQDSRARYEATAQVAWHMGFRASRELFAEDVGDGLVDQQANVLMTFVVWANRRIAHKRHLEEVAERAESQENK